MCNHMVNLAKLDDGLDESPTAMVVDKKAKYSVKIGAYSNPVGLSSRPKRKISRMSIKRLKTMKRLPPANLVLK